MMDCYNLFLELFFECLFSKTNDIFLLSSLHEIWPFESLLIFSIKKFTSLERAIHANCLIELCNLQCYLFIILYYLFITFMVFIYNFYLLERLVLKLERLTFYFTEIFRTVSMTLFSIWHVLCLV